MTILLNLEKKPLVHFSRNATLSIALKKTRHSIMVCCVIYAVNHAKQGILKGEVSLYR